jgi:hypothetical protein
LRWSMIFSENRFPLFGIMLWREQPATPTSIVPLSGEEGAGGPLGV